MVKLVLGRTAKISYAFKGEDTIIEGLLNLPISYNGFYVDVGCNHPVYISNKDLVSKV